MQGDELASIRQAAGMSRRQFGRALGFDGPSKSVFKEVKRLEEGRSKINDHTASVARSIVMQDRNSQQNAGE